MAYGEISLPPLKPIIKGRFNKGNVPHNKGKKWSEWMDGRKCKKVLKGLHRNGRKDIGGWQAKKIVCVFDGKVIGSFAHSNEAQEKTNICSRNIRSVCAGKRKKAGVFQWFYENDNNILKHLK
jgi:hypothetical protein